MTNSNSDNYYNDPRYNPFYHIGLATFTLAVLKLTLIPKLAHLYNVYPVQELFILPAIILVIITFVLWRFASGTELYQTAIIGTGLILYGLFQMLVSPFPVSDLYNILNFSISIAGSALFLSAFDIFSGKIRNNFNTLFFLMAIILSAVIIFIIIGLNVNIYG